jgi:hypothetical protein
MLQKQHDAYSVCMAAVTHSVSRIPAPPRNMKLAHSKSGTQAVETISVDVVIA